MKNNSSFLTKNRGILIFFAVMLLAPFLIGLFEGSTPLMIWGNQGSLSKFIEGLGIEIFILALFALSFDLLVWHYRFVYLLVMPCSLRWQPI